MAECSSGRIRRLIRLTFLGRAYERNDTYVWLVPAVATKEDELLYCQQGCRRVIRLTFSIRAYERDDTYVWLATASKSVEGGDKAYVLQTSIRKGRYLRVANKG